MNKATVKCFVREPDGTYSYGAFVLGGGGSGKCTVEEIARELVNRLHGEDIESILTELGWRDVLAEFSRLLAVKREQALLDQHQKQIERLKFLEEFYNEHKDHDYSWWCNDIYERMQSQPGFNEEDVSVRRIHYAAMHKISMIREYERLLSPNRADEIDSAKMID